MKKRLSEEKIDLKIGLSKINFLLIVFFLSAEILPQIPINGFCKLGSFNFSPGHTKLFSLNFNNDSYSDLILFNPSSTEISVLVGERNESFEQEKIFNFPFQISNLAAISNLKTEDKQYAFTSRKNLTAGICEFSHDGKPRVTHQIAFKSYPEKASVADINGDSQQEILIAGPSFEGLSILELEDKKLEETKIAARKSFSDAMFIDLSNDGVPDIAAVDLLNNSLEFIFNDGRGNFKFTRTITLNDKVKNLHSFDMNLDSFHDLIFIEGNKLRLIYGDFSSSYSKQAYIETKYPPADFIVGDFNKDGRIDLAYLSTDASIISVIFAASDTTFFPEIPVIYKVGMMNLIPFYSKFIDGLAAICEDGTLLMNTILSSFSSDLDISLALKPTTISYFDANSDAINDICFIDSFDNSLKLIVRNSSGKASTYYSIQLRENFNQIKVKNFSKQSTTFFCYSNEKKLIEVVEIEFSTGKIIRSELYASRPITDLEPFLNNQENIFVTSVLNNRLTVESYEKEGYWQLLTDHIISENVISADISTLKGLKLFFFKQDEDSLKMFKKTFIPAEEKTELIFKLKMNKVNRILFLADDFNNLEKESVISFVDSDEKHYILVSFNGSVNLFTMKDLKRDLIVNDFKQLFVGELKTQGARRLIINNYNNQSIYRLNILKRGKRIVLFKLLDEINTRSFFVKNMTVNKFHAVYLNQSLNCISVRQL